VDTELLSSGGQMLAKDLPMVIELLAEQLRYPAFSEEELSKAKAQFIGSQREELEDPDSRAREAFALAIYPQGHPNRPVPVEEYIKAAPAVTVAELEAFHAKYYGPDHMTLVFVGDVDAQQIEAQVAEAFAGWRGGADVVRAAAPARRAAGKGREIPIEIAGKTSTNIVIGQASGMDYRNPDAIALRLATAVLGSGFTGRLMATVRDSEGLTYGIRASLGEDTFSDGMWAVYATFAPNLLDKGIASTRRELSKWWREGITADELQARKTNLIGAYQVGLATTAGMAAALIRAAHLGYEMNWLDEYPQRLRALTLEQVNGAIKKHLDPGKMVVVKAGTLPTR
jgi:zinc protease